MTRFSTFRTLARACDNNCRARKAQSGAGEIPAIRPHSLDTPQPCKRRRDIDAAIGGIGSTRCGAIHIVCMRSPYVAN